MKCPQSRFDNPQGYNFCGKCGTPLTGADCKGRCENPDPFKFSDERGEGPGHQGAPPAYARRTPLNYTLPFLVERVLQVRSAMKGERNLFAVLFADVVGFTAIADINRLVIVRTFRHAGPDPASRNRLDSGFRQNDRVQAIMGRLIMEKGIEKSYILCQDHVETTAM